MCKKRFFAVVLAILLTVSSYAQTNQNQTNEEYPKAGFFFGAGMSNGIFLSEKLAVYSDLDLLKLSPVKIGVYYEIPLGIGNFFAGLEGGFSSGSSFGGAGGINLLPINANATFAFGIADIIYIGPGLKAGILGLLGHEKYNLLPLLGVGLDLELRYKYFPLSIYATGGVNIYPTTYNLNVLPTVEAGIRFPRGAWRSTPREDRPVTTSATPVTTATESTPSAVVPSGVTPSTPTVTSLTVNPAAVTVNQGATQQFTATVAGTNNPPQTVTWTVTGAVAGTSISPTGLLTISPNQPPGTLTVRATSTADTSRSATAAVTVPVAASQIVPPGVTAPTAPTVTTIFVNPVTSVVPQGYEQHFTAVVEGTNNPPQTVTWTVTGGTAGTSINQNGLLTVGPNEPSGTLTVRATSTADTSRSATATVTVPAPTVGAITAPPPAAVTTPPPATIMPTPSTAQPSVLAPVSGRRDITDASKQRLFAEVHFEPDTAILIESTRPQLDAAGRYLQANPNLWVLVRTYTAPFGTAEGRFLVALDRAKFCRDYFINNYGIAPERIISETLASEKLPENVVIQEWITYRTAELIMISE
jgi:outer membrane protein OmpA-like peptidoglycan-associated protein